MIESSDDGRTIEVTLRIEADPGRVWTALIHPEEIERWFPLHARGEGRDGGRIEVTWGDEGWWATTLEIVDDGRHARFVDEAAVEHGGPVLYMDYHLESDDGGTILRFVHSGFGPEDRWDDFLDALDAGWSYFFRNLKVYLEHHPGTPRTMIHARPGTRGSRPEIYAALARAVGVDPKALPAIAVGTPVTLVVGGEPVEAVLEAAVPGRTLGARVPSLEQSLLFLEIEKAGDEAKVGVWWSSYGPSAATAERLAESRDAIVAALEAR